MIATIIILPVIIQIWIISWTLSLISEPKQKIKTKTNNRSYYIIEEELKKNQQTNFEETKNANSPIVA